MSTLTEELGVCRYCEGGVAMSPAECPECEGEVMVRYEKQAELLSSETKCSNPFCTDGQTEQGSCLRCGGTGRETVARPSNPSNELPEGHWRLFSYDHLVQECMSLSRALNDNSLDSDSGTARMLLERVLFEMRPLVAKNVRLQRDIEVFLSTGAAPETFPQPFTEAPCIGGRVCEGGNIIMLMVPSDFVIDACGRYEVRPALKANACRCDPNPSIGGSPPCPVHDGENEEEV